jgi:uncharacterized membrane protein
MTEELLYSIPQWIIGLVTFVLLILAVEIGYWFGRIAKVEMTQPMKNQISTIQTAILTIFTFLLGFTFAMSLSRFDNRKQMVVKESNRTIQAICKCRIQYNVQSKCSLKRKERTKSGSKTTSDTHVVRSFYSNSKQPTFGSGRTFCDFH